MDQRTIDVYDRNAASFSKNWHSQEAANDLRTIVQRFFRPGPTADIGCGSGRDTAWLNQNGFRTTGYDPSSGLLIEARRLYPRLHFKRAALPELHEIEDASFTNVLCETVLMHLEFAAIIPSIKRLRAILKPGGILYLSWRVSKCEDQRDDDGRLYTAFNALLALQALSTCDLLLDQELISASSGKRVHRIVARERSI